MVEKEHTHTVKADWQISRVYNAPQLKLETPIPALLESLLKHGLPKNDQEILYTVLAELYANALDHGVLGLPSSLKHSVDGVEQYYAEREQHLTLLDNGSVSISISHFQHNSKCWLEIVVEDTGAGFDWKRVKEQTGGNHLFGRGLLLIQSLCQSVDFRDSGRCVHVVFALSP